MGHGQVDFFFPPGGRQASDMQATRWDMKKAGGMNGGRSLAVFLPAHQESRLPLACSCWLCQRRRFRSPWLVLVGVVCGFGAV